MACRCTSLQAADNLAALELLARFKVDPNGYSRRRAAAALSLELGRHSGRGTLAAGARRRPEPAWSQHGDAPIHVAAQRWDVAMMELLAQHGADIHQRRTDGRTALTLAELHGNEPVAAWLRAQGAKDELSPLERFVCRLLARRPHRRRRTARSNPQLAVS
jgi:hypothetical protein